MKLTGNLKKQVEKAESKDEKKSLFENAGMLLNDDELEMVSGGVGIIRNYPYAIYEPHEHEWVQQMTEEGAIGQDCYCRLCGKLKEPDGPGTSTFVETMGRIII